MSLGLVRAATRVGVTAAGVGMTTTARVSASRHLRVTATAGVRVTAADVTARMWGSAARVWGSSAGVAVRRAATWVTLMAVIARYRMSATRGTVILTAGATVTTGARTAVILRSMSARATVMRYVMPNRATVRATSMRANNTSSRELARSCCRGHRGPSVVERRT
jgi:hypothetical protein